MPHHEAFLRALPQQNKPPIFSRGSRSDGSAADRHQINITKARIMGLLSHIERTPIKRNSLDSFAEPLP